MPLCDRRLEGLSSVQVEMSISGWRVEIVTQRVFLLQILSFILWW